VFPLVHTEAEREPHQHDGANDPERRRHQNDETGAEAEREQELRNARIFIVPGPELSQRP